MRVDLSVLFTFSLDSPMVSITSGPVADCDDMRVL
jgi:hypothetical protein